MAQKRTPGLYLRDGIWYIDKKYKGRRISGSTETSNLQEAEEVLTRKLGQVRDAVVFGIRTERLFEEAAAKYIVDFQNINRDINNDISRLKGLMPFIGKYPIDQIHDETMAKFKKSRQKSVKNSTINKDIEIVSRILNLASKKWRDPASQKRWLKVSPSLTPLPSDAEDRKYAMDEKEQRYLFKELPDHIAIPCLFKVNTGTREQEVVNLQWDWEYDVPEINTTVFVVPKQYVKNATKRLIVLNDVAKSVIEGQRDKHRTHVFPYRDRPLKSLRNTAWDRARVRAAINMIKDSNDFEYLEDDSVYDRYDLLFKVECKRFSNRQPKTTTYSLDDYNKERAENKSQNHPDGLRPCTERESSARKAVYKNGWRKFFQEQWPEYAKYSRIRVHDLKHTYGSRLQARDVSLEIRKDLLGHSNGDVTTLYSAATMDKLIEASNLVCKKLSHGSPTLTLVKKKRACNFSSNALFCKELIGSGA